MTYPLVSFADRLPPDIRALYDQFNAPVTPIDCGAMCAPHNPSGKPFCCDICQAVPAAYAQEWDYLKAHTDLWHVWRGDECVANPEDAQAWQTQIPPYMRFLACLGPAFCQRNYRALSCRQFPFFPYITADERFIGLAYEWAFEPVCWVISHLADVTETYRAEFISLHDALFAHSEEVFDSYAAQSEEMRSAFQARRRRIPLLHRDGRFFLLSPASDRLRAVDPRQLPRFGPYRG